MPGSGHEEDAEDQQDVDIKMAARRFFDSRGDSDKTAHTLAEAKATHTWEGGLASPEEHDSKDDTSNLNSTGCLSLCVVFEPASNTQHTRSET